MLNILESTLDPETLSEMLAEAKTLPLARDNPSYPKCGVFTEQTAPVLFAALKLFAELHGLTLKYIQVNNATVGDGVGWHNDLQEGTDTGLILYLTRDQFDEASGGFLEMGFAADARVEILERLYPKMGRAVLFDNTNPALVHRVEPLKQARERYTVLALFYSSSR